MKLHIAIFRESFTRMDDAFVILHSLLSYYDHKINKLEQVAKMSIKL